MPLNWEAVTAICAVLTGLGILGTVIVSKIVSDKTEKLWQRIDGKFVTTELCMAHRDKEATTSANLAKDLASQESKVAAALAAQTAATAAALAATRAAEAVGLIARMIESHYLDNRARIEVLEAKI